MQTLIPLLALALLCVPIAADAQGVDAVAKALGATNLKTLEIQGSGTIFQVGQAYTPGTAYPQFNVRSFTRVINYDTGSLRQEIVQTRALEPPKGGGAYVRGEQKLLFLLSGDQAWNVAGETATPAPITLADRQFQLWSTPHGVVKAAMVGIACPPVSGLRKRIFHPWLASGSASCASFSSASRLRSYG